MSFAQRSSSRVLKQLCLAQSVGTAPSRSVSFLASAAASRLAASTCSTSSSLLHSFPSSSCAFPSLSSFPAQSRSVQTLDFGGTREKVVSRSDYPLDKIHALLGKDTFAMLGYGSQGRGQALNMRDNGLKVIVGLRKGASWDQAKEDGFVEGETLFSIEEAAKRGSTVMYMLSDAGQKAAWPTVKPQLTKGKTLFFSHGFSIVYHDQTGVVPPKDIDVILVAPKGSGRTVRSLFLQGRGINSSVAVHQDVSGKAEERAYALAVALGSGYMYETTFQKEVYSDLVGERGVLMGALQGIMQAQYEVLRSKGHTPSEAFNETVEEATQSLYPLVGEKGMDWMFGSCSTTARRGALDWYPRFYEATKPVFEQLYREVEEGRETARTLDVNSRPNYAEGLRKELEKLDHSEMWQAGRTVRSLRPENQKAAAAAAAGNDK